MPSLYLSPLVSTPHSLLPHADAHLLDLPPRGPHRNGDSSVVQDILDQVLGDRGGVGLSNRFNILCQERFVNLDTERLQALVGELQMALIHAQSTAVRNSPYLASHCGQLRFALQEVRAAAFSRLDAAMLARLCSSLDYQLQLKLSALSGKDTSTLDYKKALRETVSLNEEIGATRKAYRVALGIEAAVAMQDAEVGSANYASRKRRNGLTDQWRRESREVAFSLIRKNLVCTAENGQTLSWFTDVDNKTFADFGVVDTIERHCRSPQGSAFPYLNGMDPHAPLHLRYGQPLTLPTDKDIAAICKDAGTADSNVLMIGIPRLNDNSYDRVLIFLRVVAAEPGSKTGESFNWVMLPGRGGVIDPSVARLGIAENVDSAMALPVTSIRELTLQRAIALREIGKRSLLDIRKERSAQRGASAMQDAEHGRKQDTRIENNQYPPNQNTLETFLVNHLAGKDSARLFFFTPQTAAVRNVMAQALAQGKPIGHQQAEDLLYRSHHAAVPDTSDLMPLGDSPPVMDMSAPLFEDGFFELLTFETATDRSNTPLSHFHELVMSPSPQMGGMPVLSDDVTLPIPISQHRRGRFLDLSDEDFPPQF